MEQFEDYLVARQEPEHALWTDSTDGLLMKLCKKTGVNV